MTAGKEGLYVDAGIRTLISEAAGELGLDTDNLLHGFAKIIKDLAPENRRLLEIREQLQKNIDGYFTGRRLAEAAFDAQDYERFLVQTGYIVPEGGDFEVTTQNVDAEFTTPGPQLVCPVFIGEDPQTNARYPLNAVNTRWMSLYDALYGKPGDKNVIDEEGGKEFTEDYNPKRGVAVIAYANAFLDSAVPLKGARHGDVTAYELHQNNLRATLEDGRHVSLAAPGQFAGHYDKESVQCLLLKQNGLHIELQADRNNKIGRMNKSGLKDVVLEAAPTVIIDLEDSVSAVDAGDKVLAYRNIIGLMKGDLTAEVEKEAVHLRSLEPDKFYTMPDGSPAALPGRALILFRRVGLHMYTDAVTLAGNPVPEGYLDTLMVALASLYDVKKAPGEERNSRTGSIYIVMPKLHGPREVAHTVALFARIEQLLGLKADTLKIGIMDEEQRTSVNLKECIRAASERIVFINTGFLDRTGDLIHTAMQAGALDTKSDLKAAPWLDAYERSNVQVGLSTGLNKVGQIGKGMWTENRNPAGLVAKKGAQLKAGATTAWVPDPKNAVLHAMHYHQTDVLEVQQKLLRAGNKPIAKADILHLPLLQENLPQKEKEALLYGYMQSLLGYVTPWVDEGIGCSSVPDHTGTYLMEDRATLRIGSQLIANWLQHKIVSGEELDEAAAQAAKKVDEQNRKKENYVPLCGNFDGPAFQAAMRLVHDGAALPGGYVEPVLRAARREVKASGAYRRGSKSLYSAS